ncbi:MAG: ATP-dependent Clp protease ATP-binding subunit, partial [Oscillospiraceae bacterium]|nr:ATP-dependent Clp protease ATP-binding subunit [Oscillospiraceae bacterium]
MAKCIRCHKNTAIIYTSRFDGNQTTHAGYCLKCAYEMNLPGLQPYLKQAGVNEDNVDAITDYINETMDNLQDANPEELMQSLMSAMGENGENAAELNAQAADMLKMLLSGNQTEADEDDDEDEDDEEDEDEAEADELTQKGATPEDGAAAPGPPHAALTAGQAADDADPTKPAKADDDSTDAAAKPDQTDPAAKPKKKPGDQSVGQALQMMLTGMMGGNGENPFMPASRGTDSEAGDHDARTDSQQARRQSDRRRKKKFLEQYGSNLNELAQEGRLDPLIGRQKELDRVIQILNRRQKNNPVLLGEPGVGKTAIAQGLAERIVKHQVPAKLNDLEIYLIDMTGMVAGTQFRGQFESRMKGLVDEAKALGNVVLVIDELHNIMGAGDAEGAMNAANILKPALARGEIRVLGSTTLDEYRRYIEKDSALERRFQKVMVDEPDRETTLGILKGLRPKYEVHHHVYYSDEILEYMVTLAERYITDRFFPDKAIDIMDEAGSRANLKDHYESTKLELNEQMEKLDEEQQTVTRRLEKEPDNVALFEQQAKLRTRQLQLEAQMRQNDQHAAPQEISKEDIASVVELWTGIPLQRITETESQQLMKLEDRLHQRVIGQDEAVNALARAIRRQRAGLGKRHKPASFIFVGPTGVGKTELVKALAESLFASEDALIRLDMSEYMEAHTVSKLIGSPPGYVGYDDGGQLTERVRRKPYSVLLLDEIEKAHADVFNILLQILDDGRLTDAHGRTVSFEHTVIIMTSNAGSTLKAQGIGFGNDDYITMESRVHSVLKDLFRPEFLNRVDEIIVFKELT